MTRNGQAWLPTVEGQIREIDKDLEAIRRLGKGQSKTQSDIASWSNHFEHLWSAVRTQLGWPIVQSWKQRAAETILRPILSRIRVEELFRGQSPILTSSGISFPFPPERTVYPTHFGFSLASSGLDFWNVLGTGHYNVELVETLLCLRMAPHIDTFIDIGANVGFYSLLMAFLGTVRVVGCEPNLDNYAAFKESVAANAFSRQIEPVRTAVSHESGEGTLFTNPLGSGGHSLNASVSPAGEGQRVPLTTLDELIAARSLSTNRMFVKIDVEGTEYGILQGARRLLDSKDGQPVILIETFPCSARFPNANDRHVLGVLSDQGYNLYAILHPKQGKPPLKSVTVRQIARHGAHGGNYLAIPASKKALLKDLNLPLDIRVFTHPDGLQKLGHFISAARRGIEQRVAK